METTDSPAAFAQYIRLIAPLMARAPERKADRPRITKLTDEQKAKAVAECLAGRGTKEVAAKYGMHPDNLSKLKRKAGVQRPQVKRTAEERARAVELRKAGLSYREIGEQMGIPKATVQMWLKGTE